MVDAAGNRAPASTRPGPTASAGSTSSARAGRRAQAAPTTGDDGKIHPRGIFDAIREVAEPDYIAIADGGDLL